MYNRFKWQTGDLISAARLNNIEQGVEESVNGEITDDIREAIMTCFANVAWTDQNGQDYYDTLEYALCKYRKNYSYSAGTLAKVNGTISNAQSDPYGMHIGTGASSLSNRRIFVIDKGISTLMESSDDIEYQPTGYYPIGIPPTATSCTYAITPNTQYVGAAFYTYDLTSGKYVLVTNVGWKQGSYTHTFVAGSVQYMTIATKYDSAGTSYPTEPSALTVNFS